MANATVKTGGNGAAPQPIKARGLEGVVALDSSISFIDGKQGELIYRGYDIDDLAKNTSFEEVAYLLWNGALPTRRQLGELGQFLQAERTLPPMVLDVLRLTPEDANPMAVLRTSVSALAHFDGEADDMSPEANYRKALRLTARIPTIIAAYDRIRKGKEPLRPLQTGSTAFNFLYMLNGEEPGPSAEHTFDACLVLHAEHGLNASTFTGRVIGATLSDIYSATAGAIGALKGPLHGGANIKVMQTLLELDQTGQDPVDFIHDKLASATASTRPWIPARRSCEGWSKRSARNAAPANGTITASRSWRPWSARRTSTRMSISSAPRSTTCSASTWISTRRSL